MTRGHQTRKIFWRRRTHSIQFKPSLVLGLLERDALRIRKEEGLEERASYRCTSNIGTTCDPLILDPVLRKFVLLL